MTLVGVLFVVVLVLYGVPFLLNRFTSGPTETREPMQRVSANAVETLFGMMIILVGGLLILTGGGCTVYIGLALVSAKADEILTTMLIVSLAVLLIGIGMIWGGVSLMKRGRSDRDPRGPRT